MTQWISSVLHFGKSAHVVAVIKSDGLLLQVAKVPWPRMTPPYLMTLDLRPKEGHHMVRVVEIRAETPQACATLVTHLLAVARHACD
jgi:hypothetical protein